MTKKETYKRLTESGSKYVTNDGEHDIIIIKLDKKGYENPQYDYDSICEKLNRLAELEDKIEDGTLIELPYKLGTKLYFIVLNTFGGYFEIFETELWVYVSRYKDEFGRVDFAIEINDVDFDYETWVTAHCYSTKVEAEAKLKELQEKNND